MEGWGQTLSCQQSTNGVKGTEPGEPSLVSHHVSKLSVLRLEHRAKKKPRPGASKAQLSTILLHLRILRIRMSASALLVTTHKKRNDDHKGDNEKRNHKKRVLRV